jgi:hypothetical protein
MDMAARCLLLAADNASIGGIMHKNCNFVLDVSVPASSMDAALSVAVCMLLEAKKEM